MQKREKKAFRCAGSYGIHLVIFVAMRHGVAVSDEVRALGRRRLVVLTESKREQMTTNLAEYRAGELLPSRSKGLDETAYDAMEDDKARGKGGISNDSPFPWKGLNVPQPPVHGSGGVFGPIFPFPAQE